MYCFMQQALGGGVLASIRSRKRASQEGSSGWVRVVNWPVKCFPRTGGFDPTKRPFENESDKRNSSMKRNLMLTLTALGLAGALFCGIDLARGQTSAPATNVHRTNDRHPAIRRAIAALETAKSDMQRADHDFGGHRKEALEECDKAIAQLRLALQFDKN